MFGNKIDCPDCNGTGIVDPCLKCKGEGRIEHDCRKRPRLTLVADIYGNRSKQRSGMYSRDDLGIYRCEICNQLWQIRFQFDAGTGSDDVWLRPGESSRRFSFPEDEAITVAQILNAKTIADLPEGLVSEEGYVRRYAEERAEELKGHEKKV